MIEQANSTWNGRSDGFQANRGVMRFRYENRVNFEAKIGIWQESIKAQLV